MALELKGKVHFIGQTETVGNNFTKRVLVIKTEENPQYPQYPAIEFQKDKTALLNGLTLGQEVNVSININGKAEPYNGRYFSSIVGWKISKIEAF